MENINYSYNIIYGDRRKISIDFDDYKRLQSLVMEMSLADLLSFIEHRYAYGLIGDQNTMIKTFMILNVAAEKRFDISIDNYTNILKFISSLKWYSEKESAKLKVMKSKAIDDILVPLYARALKQSPINVRETKLIYELIQEFLPSTEYTMELIDKKIEEKIEISTSLYEVGSLTPLEIYLEKLKDEVDIIITQKYLAEHPDALSEAA